MKDKISITFGTVSAVASAITLITAVLHGGIGGILGFSWVGLLAVADIYNVYEASEKYILKKPIQPNTSPVITIRPRRYVYQTAAQPQDNPFQNQYQNQYISALQRQQYYMQQAEVYKSLQLLNQYAHLSQQHYSSQLYNLSR